MCLNFEKTSCFEQNCSKEFLGNKNNINKKKNYWEIWAVKGQRLVVIDH